MTGFYLQNDFLRYCGWLIRFKNMKGYERPTI